MSAVVEEAEFGPWKNAIANRRHSAPRRIKPTSPPRTGTSPWRMGWAGDLTAWTGSFRPGLTPGHQGLRADRPEYRSGLQLALLVGIIGMYAGRGWPTATAVVICWPSTSPCSR